MKYNDRNDIPYLKFQELQDSIQDDKENEALVVQEVLRFFYPGETDQVFAELFANACLKVCKPKLNFRIKMDLEKTASLFIDCDTFISDKQVIEMCKLVLKPKYYWSKKIDFENLSLADVEYVLNFFINALPK